MLKQLKKTKIECKKSKLDDEQLKSNLSAIESAQSACEGGLKNNKSKKKRRIITLSLVGIIVVVAGFFALKNLHMIQKVNFADENMKQLLCGTTHDYMTYGDIEKVKELELVSCTDYSTLKDIKKCTNLKELRISSSSVSDEKCELTNEQVEKIGDELNKIIPKLSDLELLELGENARWNTMDFLKDCKQLKISLFI